LAAACRHSAAKLLSSTSFRIPILSHSLPPNSTSLNNHRLFVETVFGNCNGSRSRLSTNSINPNNSWFRSSYRAFLIGCTISGGAYCTYVWGFSDLREALAKLTNGHNHVLAQVHIPVEPSDDFAHPFDKKPLWWRALLVSKRIIILASCFAPFMAFSIMFLITGSDEWR
jgi:hypothetical protein